jgi:hypothetical protein
VEEQIIQHEEANSRRRQSTMTIAPLTENIITNGSRRWSEIIVRCDIDDVFCEGCDCHCWLTSSRRNLEISRVISLVICIGGQKLSWDAIYTVLREFEEALWLCVYFCNRCLIVWPPSGPIGDDVFCEGCDCHCWLTSSRRNLEISRVRNYREMRYIPSWENLKKLYGFVYISVTDAW